MQHFSHDALARYLIHTDSQDDRMDLEWHLEHCPVCKEEITARQIIEVAKTARSRMVQVMRAGESG